MPESTYKFTLDDGRSYKVTFDRDLDDAEIKYYSDAISSGQMKFQDAPAPAPAPPKHEGNPKEPYGDIPRHGLPGSGATPEQVRAVRAAQGGFNWGAFVDGVKQTFSGRKPAPPTTTVYKNGVPTRVPQITVDMSGQQQPNTGPPAKPLSLANPASGSVTGDYSAATASQFTKAKFEQDHPDQDYGVTVMKRMRGAYGNRLDQSHLALIGAFAKVTGANMDMIKSLVAKGDYDSMRAVIGLPQAPSAKRPKLTAYGDPRTWQGLAFDRNSFERMLADPTQPGILVPGASLRYQGRDYIPRDKAMQLVRKRTGIERFDASYSVDTEDLDYLASAFGTMPTPADKAKGIVSDLISRRHDPGRQLVEALQVPSRFVREIFPTIVGLQLKLGKVASGGGGISQKDIDKIYRETRKSLGGQTIGYFIPVVGQAAFYSDIASVAADATAKGSTEPIGHFMDGMAEGFNAFAPNITGEERAIRAVNLVFALHGAKHFAENRISRPALSKQLEKTYGLSPEQSARAIEWAREAVTNGYVPEAFDANAPAPKGLNESGEAAYRIAQKGAAKFYGKVRAFLTGPSVFNSSALEHTAAEIARTEGPGARRESALVWAEGQGAAADLRNAQDHHYQEQRYGSRPPWMGQGTPPAATSAAPSSPTSTPPKSAVDAAVEGQAHVSAEGFPFYEGRRNPNDVGVLPGLQYKRFGITDTKNAVTNEYKNVTKYDQATAPPWTIWQRTDGSEWVMNGHHRRELAIRTGEPDVPVRTFREADGVDFKTARALGALQNIKDGKGTAIDAATVLRDLGVPLETLKSYGVNLKGGVGRDAAALLNLHPDALAYVEDGSVHEKVAAAIGEAGLDPKRQVAAMRAADGLETRAQGEWIAQKAKGSPTVDTSDGTGDLFGEAPEEFAWKHQAKIAEAVMRKLTSDQRLYGAVAKGKAVGETTVDAEAQRQAAMIEETARNVIAYDHETTSTLEREAIAYAKNQKRGQFDQAVRRVADRARAAAIRKLQELGQLDKGSSDGDGGRGGSGQPARGDAGSPERAGAPKLAPEPVATAPAPPARASSPLEGITEPVAARRATVEAVRQQIAATKLKPTFATQYKRYAVHSPEHIRLSGDHAEVLAGREWIRIADNQLEQIARQVGIDYKGWRDAHYEQQAQSQVHTGIIKEHPVYLEALRQERAAHANVNAADMLVRRLRQTIKAKKSTPREVQAARNELPGAKAAATEAYKAEAEATLAVTRAYEYARQVRNAVLSGGPMPDNLTKSLLATPEPTGEIPNMNPATGALIDVPEDLTLVPESVPEGGKPATEAPQTGMFSDGEARGEGQGFEFSKDPTEAAKQRLRAKFAKDPGENGPIIKEGAPLVYEMRPDGTPEVQKLGQEAVRDVGAKKTLLASAIVADFQSKNHVVLVGQKVESPLDLATVAQVYRDPRFETFRYIFTKDGVVVGQSGYSSRMPSATMIFDKPSEGATVGFIVDQMGRTGADSFWLLHNHPSGDPTPSPEDFNVTSFLNSELPGLMNGHVVIDSNKFAWINPAGNAHNVEAHNFGPDELLRPAVPHPLLGRTIDDFNDVANIGRELKTPDGFVTLVGRGASGNVRGLMDVPVDVFMKADADPARALATIRRFARQVGSPEVLMVVPDAHLVEGTKLALLKEAIESSALLDVVTTSGHSMVPGDASRYGGGKYLGRDLTAKRVQESKPEYVDETTQDLRYLAEDYGSTTFDEFRQAVHTDVGPVPDAVLQRAWDSHLLDLASRGPGTHEGTGLPKKERGDYSTEEFRKRIDAIRKIAKGGGTNVFNDLKSMTARGLFENPNKKWRFGRVRMNDLSLDQYADTLAHEVGHEADSYLTTRAKRAANPGEDIKPQHASGKIEILFGATDKTVQATIRNELVEVTKALVGARNVEEFPTYFLNSKELFARFMQSAMFHPSLIEDLAPTAFKHIVDMAADHPLIADYMQVARGAMVDHPQAVYFMPDARQGYIRKLDHYLGSKAFGEEILYRARRAQALVETEALIKRKFAGITDPQDVLFDAAEGVLRSVVDNGPDTAQGTGLARGELRPVFGTKMYRQVDMTDVDLDVLDMLRQGMTPSGEDAVTRRARKALTEIEALEAAGYRHVGTSSDGAEMFEAWRKTPNEARLAYESLSPEGQALIREYTADLGEAKDLFNRELLKHTFKIDSDIEGYVHHFGFDDEQVSTWKGLFLTERKASAQKHRGEAKGFKKDFRGATAKAIAELRIAREYNEFINKQLALVADPLAEGDSVKGGWVEISGDLRHGFSLPGARKMLLESGITVKVGKRYQVPSEVYERYLKQRLYVEEVGTFTKVANSLNRYWMTNILIHPGTAATNLISGGIQLSGKVMTDFYLDLFETKGGNRLDRTRNNVMGLLETLTPAGWKGAPDWVYGGDKSTFYGQFIHEDGAVKPLDKAADALLAGYTGIERFFKKAIINAEKRGSSAENPLNDPDFIKHVNDVVDLWAYDYQNIPVWLDKWKHSAAGSMAKPFMTYPYKYAKMLSQLAGAAFDKNLPVQERYAKLLALTTIISAIGLYEKAQQQSQTVGVLPPGSPQTFDESKLKQSVNPRGRLFIGKDGDGKDVFIRTAKYPFINAYDTIKALVTGQPDVAQDIFEDQVGTIGPLGKLLANNAFGYRSEFDTYKPDSVVNAETTSSFIPFGRIAKDLAETLDPKVREQPKTMGQVFGQFVPTTDSKLRENLAGSERTIKIPFTEDERALLHEGDEEGVVLSVRKSLGDDAANRVAEMFKKREESDAPGGYPSTVEVPLPKAQSDVLARFLGGIILKRVNPEWYRRFVERAYANAREKERRAAGLPKPDEE